MGDKPDNRPDVIVARLAGEDWGVLSGEELRRCGLTAKMIAERVSRAHLHRLHQGVYAVWPRERSARGKAPCRSEGVRERRVSSHFSAAALWEMVEWDERRTDVTVNDTTPRVHAGIRIHRTWYLDAKDVRRRRGIPVTSPARTALDLCSQLPDRGARRAVRKALSQGFLNVRQLLEVLHRQSRRPGAARLGRIVAEGAVPTRTELEDAVLDLILAAGLGRPDVNVPLILDGRRLVPDFRWPGRKLIVEADSRTWHDNKLAREDDAERQALLEEHGERVVRVTWAQAIVDRTRTMKRLRAAAGIT